MIESDLIETLPQFRKAVRDARGVYFAVMSGNACYEVKSTKAEAREFIRHVETSWGDNLDAFGVSAYALYDAHRRTLHIGGL